MRKTLKILVGQRGVGKTTLLRRLKSYFEDQEILFFDLDDEVENSTGLSILDIFSNQGEREFRIQELQTFLRILRENPDKSIYFSVGAGFPILELPPEAEIIWIRRTSDLSGRIFLDRPRLDMELTPLEEFQRRAEARHEIFQRSHDWYHVLPEGLPLLADFVCPIFRIEKNIFAHHFFIGSGGICIPSGILEQPSRCQAFFRRYTGRSLDFFELRTDLLIPDEMERILLEIPKEKFILSLRDSVESSMQFLKSQKGHNFIQDSRFKFLDIPLEFIDNDNRPFNINVLRDFLDPFLSFIESNKVILSFHGEPTPELRQLLAQFQKILPLAGIKLAPQIETLTEVLDLLNWQSLDPQHRNFLPRSLSGKWQWVRLLLKRRQKINFLSNENQDLPDQPDLLNWLLTPDYVTSFAAILGSPVAHSYTPAFHHSFFALYEMPVFRIDLSEAELQMHYQTLKKWGLRAAAVTSPLKVKAFEFATHTTEVAKKAHAANTLYFSNTEIYADNTDLAGFFVLSKEVPTDANVGIWGGGGTLSIILEALPHARIFSARTGEERTTSTLMDKSPDILVWAAPRKESTLYPPPHWRPELIIDLNYTEDSMGREYALRVGAFYVSGHKMFVAQAKQQQVFWKNHLQGSR